MPFKYGTARVGFGEVGFLWIATSAVPLARKLFCPVLSREWGNGLWGLLLGDIGTTIGIRSPIPY